MGEGPLQMMEEDRVAANPEHINRGVSTHLEQLSIFEAILQLFLQDV